MNRERLKETLIRHEGLRLKPYRCPAGKLTVGVGRNLEDNGLSREEALHLLDNDISGVEEALANALPFWPRLDDLRREILVNMGINLGVGGLLKFKKMLAALEKGNFDGAATEMLDSRWAAEVGQRATELSARMKGEDP